jgi:hypothetical protein
MFLVTKQQQHLTLAAICVLTFIGCIARSHSVAPRPVQSPTTSPSIEPSLPAHRGLQDVIPGSTTIVPGRSVGPLRLGDIRERALELFGTPDEEYTFDENSLGPCKYTEVHWNDPKHDDRWGIFVYSKNNRIYQIMTDTPRFATAGRITSDSSPDEVQRLFPNLQSYVLLGSGSKVNGGENLIYWVDQNAGIAFEFYHHPKLNKRRLASTIVFEPGGEFLPTGCISPPQEWRKLKSFSL